MFNNGGEKESDEMAISAQTTTGGLLDLGRLGAAGSPFQSFTGLAAAPRSSSYLLTQSAIPKVQWCALLFSVAARTIQRSHPNHPGLKFESTATIVN